MRKITEIWPLCTALVVLASVLLELASGAAPAAVPGVVPGAIPGAVDPKAFTPQLTFYPTRDAAKFARIVFEFPSAGSYFVLIHDAKGQMLRCLATGHKERGPVAIDWDGKDSAGVLVPEGAYKATLSAGLKWELDKTFGKGGRIGQFTATQTIDNPQDASVGVGGDPFIVKVNGAEYNKADDLAAPGHNYTVKDGTVRINPKGGAKKGDKLTASYCYPSYFQGPWDAAFDEEGNVFVLMRWVLPATQMMRSQLLKITPDGRGLDKEFGDAGRLPAFCPSSQVLVSNQDKRLIIAGSHYDCWGTGVYSLESGAYHYFIGQYAKTIGDTWVPIGGICLGTGNKLYLLCGGTGILTYDRTQEGGKGYLAHTIKPRIGGGDMYPAVSGDYWGPCMESGPEDNTFYVTTQNSDIVKFKDDGKAIVELYHLDVAGTPTVGGNPVGISLDRQTRLIYASLRAVPGQVDVFFDDGLGLTEVARLKDPELGPTHTVRYRDGRLYVIEDGFALQPNGTVDAGMRKAGFDPQGKNRLSRYRVSFEKETPLATLERK